MSDTLLPAVALACLAILLVALLTMAAVALANFFTNRYMPDHPCVRRKRETRRHYPTYLGPQ